MVNSRTFWIGYPLLLLASLLAYWYTPVLQSHPLTLLYFLLLIGVPEVYYLAVYTAPYFHWFFGHRSTVVNEIRRALLVYLVFLVAAIGTNLVINHRLFLITTALILPLVAGIMGFCSEAWQYAKARGYWK